MNDREIIKLEQFRQLKKEIQDSLPQEIKMTPSEAHFPSMSGFGVRKTFYKNI